MIGAAVVVDESFDNLHESVQEVLDGGYDDGSGAGQVDVPMGEPSCMDNCFADPVSCGGVYLCGEPIQFKDRNSMFFQLVGLGLLCLGTVFMGEGIAMGQKNNVFQDIELIVANGTEFYLVVILMAIYSVLQVINVLRSLGLLFNEFLSLIGAVTVFICGAMSWFAIVVPTKMWTPNEGENTCNSHAAFCTGMHMILAGSCIYVAGVIALQTYHMYLSYLMGQRGTIVHAVQALGQAVSLEMQDVSSHRHAATSDSDSGSEAGMQQQGFSDSEGDQQDVDAVGEKRFVDAMSVRAMASVMSFQYTHGTFIALLVVAIFPYVVSFSMHITDMEKSPYEEAQLIDLGVSGGLILLSLVLGSLLLFKFEFRMKLYLVVYAFNIFITAVLGVAIFVSGGCRIMGMQKSDACTFDMLLFSSTFFFFCILTLDQAFILIAVEYGAAQRPERYAPMDSRGTSTREVLSDDEAYVIGDNGMEQRVELDDFVEAKQFKANTDV
tara:strand:- start:1609 stop:3090 length:1482 start_codon:yes stop_codon:yes gene_type:complete